MNIKQELKNSPWPISARALRALNRLEARIVDLEEALARKLAKKEAPAKVKEAPAKKAPAKKAPAKKAPKAKK